ncbi:MAG: hypothetical protein CMO73_13360 [Verrucomicrobiales bacterium]|nr:hypothetical protein [Verrucomicrobiales bacterium]
MIMKPFLALLLFVLPSCVGISGSGHEPLSRISSDRGMFVLDGHEEVAITQEKAEPKSLPFTSIPWNWFD